MNSLINLYDNSLIYYPNIFFPLFLLFSILGIILLVIVSLLLVREFTKIYKEIRINLSKIKIKKRKGIKISTSKLTIKVFYLIKFAWNFIVKINNMLRHLKLKMEKIIMKIKKDVLVD